MTQHIYHNFDLLPDSAMVRLDQIIGSVKKSRNNTQEEQTFIGAPLRLVPVSRATWWRFVRSGRAPAPVKISPGVTAWRVGDIRTWLADQST